MSKHTAALLLVCAPLSWAVGPPARVAGPAEENSEAPISPPGTGEPGDSRSSAPTAKTARKYELRAFQYLAIPLWGGLVVPLDLRTKGKEESVWRGAVRDVFDYLRTDSPTKQREALEFLTMYVGFCLSAEPELGAAVTSEEVVRLTFGRHAASCRRQFARLLASPEKDVAGPAAALLLRIDPEHVGARRALADGLSAPETSSREMAWTATAQLRLTVPEVVDRLGDALADPSRAVRHAALEATQFVGPKAGAVWPQVVELVRRDDASQYADDFFHRETNYALLALAALRQEAHPAIGQLVRFLRGVGEKRFREVCQAVGQIAPPRLIPVRQLQGLLTSSSQAKRLHAAALILRGAPDHPVALGVFRKALAASDPGAQALAVKALASCSASPPALLPSLRNGVRSEDAHVRISVLRALGGYGVGAVPAIPELVRFLKYGREVATNMTSTEEQQLAARALGHVGPRAQPLLIALVRDPKAEFRFEALEELIRQPAPSPETVQALLSFLNGPDQLPPALEGVNELLDIQDPLGRLLKCTAAVGLGRMGGAARVAAPALKRMLADKAWWEALGHKRSRWVLRVAIDCSLRRIEGHARPFE